MLTRSMSMLVETIAAYRPTLDFLLEVDLNEDGVVEFEDISPFIIRLFS